MARGWKGTSLVASLPVKPSGCTHTSQFTDFLVIAASRHHVAHREKSEASPVCLVCTRYQRKR